MNDDDTDNTDNEVDETANTNLDSNNKLDFDNNDSNKVTPIWSRLEKILEKGETSTSSQPIDLIGFMNFRLSIERAALELSSISISKKGGGNITYPPNLKLAESISNYILARLGMPKGDKE